MLIALLKKALKAGGAQMPATKFAKVFGNDDRLRRNVVHACAVPYLTTAINAEVICDHRVIETMGKVDPLAARIILEVEAKLGRKLPRSRAAKLVEAYQRIATDRKSREAAAMEMAAHSMQQTRQILQSIVNAASTVPAVAVCAK